MLKNATANFYLYRLIYNRFVDAGILAYKKSILTTLSEKENLIPKLIIPLKYPQFRGETVKQFP